MRTYYVYIATNKWNKVLYIGVTNSIERRMFEHEMKSNSNSFTAKYNVNKLVYVENTHYINDAIAREKQLKSWTREKKLQLINTSNPDWIDLLIEEYN